jgi:uncharacterized protein (DUF2235 family)
MAWEKRIDVDFSTPPQPRNIIVLLDGTWNDENGRQNNGAVTNIYKLYTSMAGTETREAIPFKRETPTQLALYFRGVGNDEDASLKKTYFQGAFGAGEKNIRDHAYTNIVRHYRPGDRIFIIGFSRGAACARLLSAKLERDGIPRWIEIQYEDQVNKSSGKIEKRFLKYRHAKTGAKKDLSIEFLGLFDTVGAFGIPINLGFNFQKVNLFKDMTVSKIVKKTVHLVSIDESREPFLPTLVNKRANVEEVWFPGVHADVGGGYYHSELGNLSMEFMIRRLQTEADALPIDLIQDEIDKHISVDLNNTVHMHHHGDGFKKDSRKIFVQENDDPTREKPLIHASVRKLMEHADFKLVESHNSYKEHHPIEYHPLSFKRTGNHFIEVP